MANRLARSLSPYLRQHANNPVDWWEWGPDAFAEAARREVPVFLSVGYAACHWCHVMAHESFEDVTVAEALAAGFVAVKVDREERPDIDAVYMAATTALTGHGGWPMTCLLTTDGEPFFAGTYLPKANLLALLDGAGAAWRERRADVLDSASRISEHLRTLSTPPPPVAADPGLLDEAITRLRRTFDVTRGGFGGAPKFPPSMVLTFLIRHHARTGSPDALAMATRTADAMARGGIYDQLAGGFARYAVDADWVIPHFEKMLYDNALLARAYAHLARIDDDPLWTRIACETADFIVHGLGTPEGGFASALDADTVVDGHSVEGLTYVWTPADLAAVLGREESARAASLLAVTDTGTFEHGTSILQLRTDPDDPVWWTSARARLLAARDARPQPAPDDKVLASWNGLAIAALADIGVQFDRPDLLTAAGRAAEFVLGTHVVDGTLRRVSLGGTVGSALGQLDDHGNLAEGFLALHQATGDPAWLTAAGTLLDAAIAAFRDGAGVWHDSPAGGETLIVRPRGEADNAEPSGVASVGQSLLTYAALTGSARHRTAAAGALAVSMPLAARDPRFAGWGLAGAEALTAGPLQVAVVGAGERADDLLRAVRRSASPGLVVAHGHPDSPGQPLLAGRALVEGGAAAYVCRGFVCERPVTTSAEVHESLRHT